MEVMTRRLPLPGRPSLRFIVAWVLLTTLFAVLIYAGLTFLGVGSSDPRLGKSADFTLNDLSNRPVHLADFRGRPVLVNLWASWCVPCRDEMPDLMAFYHAHQSERLVILAVNTLDEFDAAQQFAEEKALPFPVLFDPDGHVQRLLRANGLPSTFLVDRNGTVRFAWMGQISPNVLNQQVAPLLVQ